MKIAVFGLGYVGTVSAACLARAGHTVIGVDIHPWKIDAVNSGNSPVSEPHVKEMLAEAVEDGRVWATSDGFGAVQETDASLVCVGTPSRQDGSIDTKAIARVVDTIGRGIAASDKRHIVLMRSTALPGTASAAMESLGTRSGKTPGVDFGFCVNPEFLREGSAVQDFENPPFTIIGESDPVSGEIAASIYEPLGSAVFRVGLGTAEMVKYASNAFHAVKVAFSNEISSICKAYGVNGNEVMDLVTQDTKLNVSSAYMRPGFSFGGSCLPKDLRAITHKAGEMAVATPVLDAVLPSNEQRTASGVHMVLETGAQNISILGVTFKAGTDDLRESPMVDLAEALLREGRNLRIFDVHLPVGKEVYPLQLPIFSEFLVDRVEDAVGFGDVVVIGTGATDIQATIESLPNDRPRIIVDLVGCVDPDWVPHGHELRSLV